MSNLARKLTRAELQARVAEIVGHEDLFVFQGALYYAHEGGMIATASIWDIVNRPDAVPLAFAESIPAGAEVYDLPEGSDRERRTDAWTDAVDRAVKGQAFA